MFLSMFGCLLDVLTAGNLCYSSFPVASGIPALTAIILLIMVGISLLAVGLVWFFREVSLGDKHYVSPRYYLSLYRYLHVPIFLCLYLLYIDVPMCIFKASIHLFIPHQ